MYQSSCRGNGREHSMVYKINEIFYSIQGEGYWAGRAAIFIRFSGCNLACDYCDTEDDEYEELHLNEIYSKLQIQRDLCYLNDSELMVVLTGGEPTLQDIEPLVEVLDECGFFIAVETNGSFPGALAKLNKIDWITLSPKYQVTYDAKEFDWTPNEIKLIFDWRMSPSQWLEWPSTHYFLQPKYLGHQGIKTNYEEVINYIKENPQWRLSLQMQKHLNIK